MQNRKRISILITALTLISLLAPSKIVSAHGSTQVGDYQIEIGFRNEPALQGQLNGLELIVTNTKTQKPVTGLENTLKGEVIFGASKKPVKIEPVEGEDGTYTAPVLPTEVGDYTWHIFGTIENTPVDVSMTSSPTTFASVDPPSTVSFPGSEPGASDLQAELQGARQTAQIALVVAVVGTLIGLAGLAMALTRGRSSR